MNPAETLPGDVGFLGRQGKPLRAVFLNYLLDCLPAAVLQFEEDDKVSQLHVRTCIARNVRLEDYTDLKPEQLTQRAKSGDPNSQQELLEVYGLFASEYDYRPVEIDTLMLGKFACELARGKRKRFLHSYGAIQSLEKLMTLVHQHGFILMNDYGTVGIGADDEFEHQRFSLATFVGVNFGELKAYFEKDGRYDWKSPYGDAGGIHSRLLAHQPNRETDTRFMKLFGVGELERLNEPIAKARRWLQVGRFELAAGDYQEALKRQPYNWVLLNEIAMFLIFQLRDIKKGIDLAKLALQQNPTCSAELWNTLGDGLFEWGRLPEARSAYQKALAVNDSDVRARFNLSWVHIREKNYPAALSMIAEGLALDKTGEYRERFLQKQEEALALLHLRNQQEYLTLINLVSKSAGDGPESPKPDADKRADNDPLAG